MRLRCAGSIWMIAFTRAGRHHFLLQVYLMRAGAQLTWLAPGRLGFDPPAPTADALDRLQAAILTAAKHMVEDGWWAAPGEVAIASERAIRWRLLREVGASVAARLAAAARSVLRAERAA